MCSVNMNGMQSNEQVYVLEGELLADRIGVGELQIKGAVKFLPN